MLTQPVADRAQPLGQHERPLRQLPAERVIARSSPWKRQCAPPSAIRQPGASDPGATAPAGVWPLNAVTDNWPSPLGNGSAGRPG